MRDIAALVFGGKPGRRETCEPQDRHSCGAPAPKAGDWCQTEPGEPAINWLLASLGASPSGRGRRERGRARP